MSTQDRRRYADPTYEEPFQIKGTRLRHFDEAQQRISNRHVIDSAVKAAGGQPGMSQVDRNKFAEDRQLAPGRMDPRAMTMHHDPTAFAGTGSAPLPAPVVNPSNPRAPGVATHLPGPTIAKGDTNPAHVASALAANKAAVAPGGMGNVSYTQNAQTSAPMVPRTFTSPAVANNSTQLHDPTAENAAAGVVKKVTPTKTTLASQYGDASATTPQQRNQALFERHPNIFTAGTPENEAFVAHAKKYGLDAAHQNVDALMATLRPGNAAGATGSMAKNDTQQAPTPERVQQLTDSATPSIGTRIKNKVASVLPNISGESGGFGPGPALKGIGNAVAGFVGRNLGPNARNPRLPDFSEDEKKPKRPFIQPEMATGF